MSFVTDNLFRIRDRIARAADRAGRVPAEVELVAVTKNVELPLVQQAVRAGVENLGENRVQELLRKQLLLEKSIRWHLIGHLQTNKVKQIIGCAHMVHSLDRMALAEEMDKRSTALGIKAEVLVQVNVAEEETKYGLSVDEVPVFLRRISGLGGLRVKGLMTMAPLVDNPEDVRFVFRGLKLLAEKIQDLSLPGVDMLYLSMGMTNDFEVAVEEGSNVVRIGTGIFSPYRKG